MGEKNWIKKGALPEGAFPKAVALSPEGYGLISSFTEPDEGSPTEQLRHRKAQLLRVTSVGVEQVYEGAGWIQALDGDGPVWFAVGATLKATGSGSDYRLLRSTDGGRTWQARGSILATSVSQVLAVGQNEAWVLGAGHLGVTVDGGASWRPVQVDGERNPSLERLRRVDGGVALLGQGLAITQDGGYSWTRDPVGGARVHDLEGKLLVVRTDDGRVGVGSRQGSAITWISGLPSGRVPMRITSSGQLVRVLSRSEDPTQGADLNLYRSEDGGTEWEEISLDPLRVEADIAGELGIGLSLLGEIRTNL